MNEKIAKLGKPSLVFGKGQERRLDLVRKHIDLKGKRVLDVGCGIGMYSGRFSEEGAAVFGIDIDRENIKRAKKLFPKAHFSLAEAERSPYEDGSFDIVFLHEVLEHVKNDKIAIAEALRVLKPGGRIIIFSPNRLFPFETHGIYLGKKYIFGNIPFVNWLPLKIRNLVCSHVKVYTARDLKGLFVGKKVDFEKISFVWPAFDKIERKFPKAGKILKKIASLAERNWVLAKFGISIFMVVRKIK